MEQLDTKKWLYVIGLDAADTTFPETHNADLIVGGVRHLELLKANGSVAGELMTWKSPLTDTIVDILAFRGKKVVVLATGDPQYYGIGVTLSKHVDINEMEIRPARSAFSLAASRLGWALSEVECLTLHGRPLEMLLPHLQPCAKLFALSHDKTTPKLVAEMLVEHGYREATIHILENMGAKSERHLSTSAQDFDFEDLADLNTLAIEIPNRNHTAFLPRYTSLPDDAFQSDGQLTKQEVRAATLSALKPYRHATLWDVGAGCGSIAIEWMRMDKTMKAIAFEHQAKRIELIKQNRKHLGVPLLKVVEGDALEMIEAYDSPDAIFIGGGITLEGLFEACFEKLKQGGTLVANVVTAESEAKCFELYKAYGGDLTRIAISRAKPVGKFTGWESLMPVTQFRIKK
jgi:precorrin-6Y C5,15-methyltransferase (decarboxylating)